MSNDLQFLVMRRDPWCLMAIGEGSTRASGCRPVAEVVSRDAFIRTMQTDMGNRAERRAAAKRSRRQRVQT